MNGANPVQAGFVQAIRGPIMLIALGTLVEIDYLGVYGFWRTWPLLIIVFGVLKLLEHAGAKPPASYPGGPPTSYPGGPPTSYPGGPPASYPGGPMDMSKPPGGEMGGPSGGNVI